METAKYPEYTNRHGFRNHYSIHLVDEGILRSNRLALAFVFAGLAWFAVYPNCGV